MKNPFRFFVELMQQPLWVPLWVFFLMAVNAASLIFWSEPLAKLIFFTFMVSSILMMALYSYFGFKKILGLGHALWIPLLAYVTIQLPSMEGVFRAYLILLSISIAISLAFDTMDMWSYFKASRVREVNKLTS